MGTTARVEPPDFVAIGHVTIDITPTPTHPEGQRRYGGAAAYAAMTAASMGLSAGILTSASADYPFAEITRGVDVVNVESPNTTTFQNVYRDGNRKQILAARAGDITLSDVPDSWTSGTSGRSAPLVVICPLARELPLDAYAWFPEAGAIGLVLQGFFRHWDDYRVVSVRPEFPAPDRGKVAVAVASQGELSPSEARRWNKAADVVARTQGRDGAELYSAGGMSRVPTPAADEIDPTGAGDVWAAAYLIRIHETGDIETAARFACAAASLSVTGIGLSGIPTRDEVERKAALLQR